MLGLTEIQAVTNRSIVLNSKAKFTKDKTKQNKNPTISYIVTQSQFLNHVPWIITSFSLLLSTSKISF